MTVCYSCGKEFIHIGKHWAQSSSCGYKELSSKQEDVVCGLLMGDGSINRESGRKPRIQCSMITKKYLEYLNECVFPDIGTNVILKRDAEESFEHAHSRGFDGDSSPEEYSNVYKWQSRGHPELEQFSEWYDSGSKVWPNGIELNSTVLKHWFVCDGSWNNGEKTNSIKISAANERQNKDKIESMFGDIGIEVSNWSESKRPSGGYTCDIQFSRSDSHRLWEYMGEPLPGFEYKWPKEYR